MPKELAATCIVVLLFIAFEVVAHLADWLYKRKGH